MNPRHIPISAGWEWVSVRIGDMTECFRELGELKIVNGDDILGNEKSMILGSSGGMVMYMESETCNIGSCVIASTPEGAGA
jgi:hypothetical protein